ncbi:sugar transferase [Roseovarius amoyensis]|uniref:sugar transferase n=1 Tax=Roseovarius amoyensis TaxID=2211448 RepID=UPI000DBE3249|nr:sugar transferase [Roseovarius amoyensis]
MSDVYLHPVSIRSSARLDVKASLGATFYPANTSATPSHLGTGAPAGARQRGLGSIYRRFGKRAFDIALVLAFAPLYLPLIGGAALMLTVEGGNPFYRQERLGRSGNRFTIFKLRTMERDAEQRLEEVLAADPELRREWDVTQKLRHDPRVTRVGEFLRRTSLDELPQLWNVLKGDMSLVGPRPMLPEQLPLYGDPAHYFALRPGISGDWQVSRRNEGSFAERASYDADYDAALSLGRDLRILWRTIGVVRKRTGC